jgi:hypothetical protein
MRWGFPSPHFGFARRGLRTSSPASPRGVFGNADGGNFPPSTVGRGARFLLLAPDRIRLVPFARSPRTTVATPTIPAGFARFDRCEVTHRPGHATVRAAALQSLLPRIRTGLLLEPLIIASLWMRPLPGAPSATPLAFCVRVQRAPDRCVLRNRLAQPAVTARSHNASRQCTSAQSAQSGDRQDLSTLRQSGQANPCMMNRKGHRAPSNERDLKRTCAPLVSLCSARYVSTSTRRRRCHQTCPFRSDSRTNRWIQLPRNYLHVLAERLGAQLADFTLSGANSTAILDKRWYRWSPIWAEEPGTPDEATQPAEPPASVVPRLPGRRSGCSVKPPKDVEQITGNDQYPRSVRVRNTR